MSLFSLTAIAIGLSLDAFTVSIASGIRIPRMRLRQAMLIASFFGAFQAVMPVIGWSVGWWGRSFIRAVDHWIAFLLLLLIGGKMLYAGLLGGDEVAPQNPLNLHVLCLLSLATSIDALAVGFTLSVLDVSIVAPVVTIGGTTFLLCLIGTYIGNVCGHLGEQNFEVVGGLILIGIGTKILLEHLLG